MEYIERNVNKPIRFGIDDYVHLTYEEALSKSDKNNLVKAIKVYLKRKKKKVL